MEIRLQSINDLFKGDELSQFEKLSLKAKKFTFKNRDLSQTMFASTTVKAVKYIVTKVATSISGSTYRQSSSNSEIQIAKLELKTWGKNSTKLSIELPSDNEKELIKASTLLSEAQCKIANCGNKKK